MADDDQMKADIPTEVQEQLRPIEKENAAALRCVKIYSIVCTFIIFRSGDIDKALSGHHKEITLLQEKVPEPHQIHVTMRNSFQYCWWNKIANELSK